MGRLIDTDVVAMTATCPKGMDIDSFIAGMGVVLDRIAEAPTVDAVQVVRCRECKHRCGHMDGYTECDKTERIRIWHPNDWFCADGKRKEQSDG